MATSKNNDKNKLSEKTENEIKYLDENLIKIFNQMNNIKYESYKISVNTANPSNMEEGTNQSNQKVVEVLEIQVNQVQAQESQMSLQKVRKAIIQEVKVVAIKEKVVKINQVMKHQEVIVVAQKQVKRNMNYKRKEY